MSYQGSWMRAGRLAAVSLMMVGVGSQVGAAQFSSQSTQDLPGQHSHPKPGNLGDSDAPPDVKARMEEQQKRVINEERHKKLISDTDKLLALANELKTEVAKSQKDELNVVVVRKAGEMEKLAHDVKTRMTY